MTQENVSRRSAWFSLSLMLFVSERFCSAKSANLLLFHHRVNRYLLGDGIGPDRAVDVRQSLFYNSGKVLRLGVDVCHLRRGFPLPETELCGVQYLLADDDGGLYDGKGNPYVLR